MLRLGDEATSNGMLFQTVAPATGNARSLKVDSRQRGTSRWCDVDCGQTKGTNPAMDSRVEMLMKYDGAESCATYTPAPLS
jgi:hypothetical protein